MPQGDVPDRYLDLLQSATIGHLATIGMDGRPQVNPVWFLWEGERLWLGVKGDTGKYRNLRRISALALSIVDPANPQRYLELRGRVTEFKLFRTLEFVNQLSFKYTGQPMDPDEDGKERYRLAVEIDSWTGQ